jgi:predicted transcriptional regulator
MEVVMPEPTTTITVRIPADLKQRLDRLSELTRRSRSYLAAEALDAYARSELEIVDGMLESMEDFEAGRFHTRDEMIAATEEAISAARKRKTSPSPAKPKAKATRKAA